MKIKKHWIYYLIPILFFTTETWILNIGGGNFKGYFFVSILFLFTYLPVFKRLGNSKIFIATLLLIFAMLVSSAWSSNVGGAINNTISNILYMSTSYVLIILMLKKINAFDFFDLVYGILLFMICFGLAQYVLYKFAHISIGNASFTVSEGQITALGTEPNAHGKIVGLAIVFCIPPLIRLEKKQKKKYTKLLLLSLLTMALSITRNAIYSILIAGIAMIIYYIPQRKTSLKMQKYFLLSAVLIGVFVLMVGSGTITLEGRNLDKFSNLFFDSIEEVSNDGSGSFRIPALLASMNAWLLSPKTILFGNGPGQAYAQVTTFVTRVAGNGTLMFLPGIGLIGTAIYWFILLMPIFYSRKVMKSTTNSTIKIMAEQSFFMAIYVFAMDFIAPSYYYANLWLVVALGMYWELYLNNPSLRQSLEG